MRLAALSPQMRSRARRRDLGLLKTCTFQELVESEYYAVGFCKEQMLNKVSLGAGVSRSSVRAAVNGTRVSPTVAQSLYIWAATIHKVELDKLKLMEAPTKPARERGDPGKRAEELIEAAVNDAQLPADSSCTVTLDLSSGLWVVECRDVGRDGSVSAAHKTLAPELSEALGAMRDAYYGEARTA